MAFCFPSFLQICLPDAKKALNSDHLSATIYAEPIYTQSIYETYGHACSDLRDLNSFELYHRLVGFVEMLLLQLLDPLDFYLDDILEQACDMLFLTHLD